MMQLTVPDFLSPTLTLIMEYVKEASHISLQVCSIDFLS